MGTRVQTILKSKDREIYDLILFSNSTSFDAESVIKEAIANSKNLDEVKEILFNYQEYSDIASRVEKFHIDNEPFGDYDYILLVKETPTKIKLDEIELEDYMPIANIDSNKVEL